MDCLEVFEGLNLEVKRQAMLSELTTLKIGGPASMLIVPGDIETAVEVVKRLRENSINYFVLGGGSNILMPDKGLECVVLMLKGLKTMEIIGEGAEVTVYAEAGITLQGVVNRVAEIGLTGLEGLIGIPGTLGGAVFGNAGAFGYEIMDVVEEIDILRDGKRVVLGGRDLNYGYRDSGLKEKDVILSVRLRLKKDDREDIMKRMRQYIYVKRQSQPLGEASAGCVFKNPEGQSAGQLIDLAGCKGMRKGDIEVSSKHANFFINKGMGRAEDFIALMDEVRERVMRLFSIELEPEIRIIGRQG